jgi:hypothetical protein
MCPPHKFKFEQWIAIGTRSGGELATLGSRETHTVQLPQLVVSLEKTIFAVVEPGAT